MRTSARTLLSRGAAAVATIVTALALAACAAAASPPPPTDVGRRAPSEAPTTAPPELTVADIVEWAADAEWSFAPHGLGEPFTIQLTDGKATDEFDRSYELGEAVGADVDGDGVVDAAIPIMELDGNGAVQLWYVWLGRAPGSGPVAEQVVYPLARTTRCGDATHSVTAVDGGLRIDLSLRMPFTDDTVPCSEPGSGALTRVVHVEEIDGDWYPIQSEPVPAWGGICPPTEWLDGVEEVGISGRAAPPASAPIVTDPDAPIGLFALPEAPLVQAGGASFFGFIQGGDDNATVKLHCAFAD